MNENRERRQIDLHPGEWGHASDDTRPGKVGNDPLPGEKPHIWQEFRRDMHVRREPGQPFIGQGWPLGVGILLTIAILTWIKRGGGPEWLIALRNLF